MGDTDRPVAPAVVVDNTVLSNLALVRMADLLDRLWPTAACTTPAVQEEYHAGAARGLVLADGWAGLSIVTMTEEEMALADRLTARMGAGERSCLAVAVYRGALLASDDLDARRAAQQMGVPLTGTIGILAVCVRQGHLSLEEANRLLATMISLGYRSPLDRLDGLVGVP